MARTNNTVPKVITNVLGHKQTVHVKADQGASADPKVQDRLTQAVTTKNWGVVPEIKDSPWGRAEHQDHVDDGIARVSIDGFTVYNAYKLSKRRNDAVPEELRQANGWYQEGNESAILAFAFPESFSEEEVEYAHGTLKNQYWRQYESMTGETLSEDESYGKQIGLFEEANKDNFVGTSENVRKSPFWREHLIVEARRSADNKTGHYLVPVEEYRSAKYAQLVIDPERHLDANATSEEWPISPNELAQRNELESFAFQWADSLKGLSGFETNDERNYFAHWASTTAEWDDIDNRVVDPNRQTVVEDWRVNHKKYIAEAEEQASKDAARRQRENDEAMQGFWDNEG